MADSLRDRLVIAIREWIPVPARTGIVLDVGGEPSAERQRLADRAADAALAVLREWPDAEEVARLVGLRASLLFGDGGRIPTELIRCIEGRIVRAPKEGCDAEASAVNWRDDHKCSHLVAYYRGACFSCSARRCCHECWESRCPDGPHREGVAPVKRGGEGAA